MKMSYRNSHSFKERNNEAKKLKENNQDKIPCIVEKAERSKIQDIDKKKFLVPSSLTIGQFIYVIRMRLKLRPQETIIIYVNDYIPPVANTMSVVYEQYKDEDGFLYITYSTENTFG